MENTCPLGIVCLKSITADIWIKSSNYLMDEIIPKCSNDYLKHTGSIGYRGSSDLLASIHELTQLSDESDGYTTPPSDFVSNLSVKHYTHFYPKEHYTYANNNCFSLQVHDYGSELWS